MVSAGAALLTDNPHDRLLGNVAWAMTAWLPQIPQGRHTEPSSNQWALEGADHKLSAVSTGRYDSLPCRVRRRIR